MKHLYLFCILIFLNLLSKEIKAQYITLPDTNFRNYLQSKYPQLNVYFNSNRQLDTVSVGSAAINTIIINDSLGLITDLTGIQYFKIDTFTFAQEYGIITIVNLPSLPASLKYFDILAGGLSNWPSLPDSLIYFDSGIPTSTLPALPNSLKTLECSNNGLTSLPALPNSLISFDCVGNHLTSLPPLPSSLVSFSCDNNNITCMPAIPKSVISFSATGNKFACIYDMSPYVDTDSTYSICTPGNNTNHCPYDTHFVSISDVNFSLYIQSSYPSCLNLAGMVDTTCSLIVNATSLNLSNFGISDLTGIQYFKNLDTLNCSGNNLIGLPPLPASLTYLDCSNNKLTSLPALPPSLTDLKCPSNNLTNLPTLPATLKNIICYVNQLTSLPPLPASLDSLFCGENQLTCLPLLPAKLKLLDIASTNITCLPNYPPSLNSNNIDAIIGVCNDTTNTYNCPIDTNFISILDTNWGNYLQIHFPGCINFGGQLDTTCTAVLNTTSLNLSNLNVSDLTGIQYFKNLDTLNCSGNNLTSLPPLPASLTYLDCSNNQLTSLPDLPGATIISGRTSQATSLLTLDCQNNQIHCLPVLPDGLQTLAAMGNPIACVLNLPSSLTSVDSTYSICNSSNDTYGCIQQVTGTTNAMVSATIEVYPNPSTGIVTISCPSVATGIKVAGMDGITVYQTTANNSAYTADLSNQGKGVYVVQIFSASGVATQKLVLE